MYIFLLYDLSIEKKDEIVQLLLLWLYKFQLLVEEKDAHYNLSAEQMLK